MKERRVIPEILDSLPHEDAAAVRARRDLRHVNALMGNYRWVRGRILSSQQRRWFELGAGEGRLAAPGDLLAAGVAVTGLDFAPRPADWPESWEWKQGDLFTATGGAGGKGSPLSEPGPEAGSGGCLAVLFLHHFEDPGLRRLGEFLESRFDHLLFVEPARYRLFRLLSSCLLPFVNAVTRHDMPVSIGAGFRPGELTRALGLAESWTVVESVHWLGGLRFEAWKQVS